MFFAEYSLLAMFDTYPASRCATQNMYTCVCAGLVVIDSLGTALGSLKEEERKKEEDLREHRHAEPDKARQSKNGVKDAQTKQST